MLRGEDINLGLGIETVRGTPVAPAIWVPARTASSIGPRVDKVNVRETRSTKVSSQGSEVVKSMAGGALEFNVRSKSIGYILKSLLGSVSSGAVSGQSGAYDHVFTILPNTPQHPSLTMALARGAKQHYEYALGLAGSAEIKITPDDLVNATAEFLASVEAEHASYTPSFGSDDPYFRHQDVAIRIADDLAGLTGATPIKVKEASISIDNKARDNQNVSEENPGDIIATDFEIGGNLSMDYLDDTYHDIFKAGTYKALKISMVNTSVVIGTNTNPAIHIELPKFSLASYDEDRPIDDIVTQGLGIMAHYSLADAMAIRITVRNTKANYTS